MANRENLEITKTTDSKKETITFDHCIIAAGSVVLENTICESGYIYAGTPAKRIKPITEEQRALLNQLPDNYIMYSSWFAI